MIPDSTFSFYVIWQKAMPSFAIKIGCNFKYLLFRK